MSSEILEIKHNGEFFYVDKLKISYVLSKLTNKNNIKSSNDEIIELMNKYKLIDKNFLTNINRI